MAALPIDPNHWQEIYPVSYDGIDLVGTGLFNSTIMPNFNTGSTFLQPPSDGSLKHQWQIFPLNSTIYVLRTKDSGPKGFMNTQYAPTLDATGNIAVNMRNSTIDDEAMLWNIGSWPDKSLFFTNVANGTNWVLSANVNASTLMAPNNSAPEQKLGQSWQLRQGDAINDSAYSFVLGMPINIASPTTSTSTVSVAPTSTTSVTDTPTSAPLSSSTGSHQGLSSGASAGIGVGVAAVAITAAISLIFLFLRRRKAKALEKQPPTYYEDPMLKPELPSEHMYPAGERTSTQPVEMGDRDATALVEMGDMEAATPVAELMVVTDGRR